MECPICKARNRITLINPENMAYSDSKEDAIKNGYFFEEQTFSEAKCWNCGNEFKLQGEISWNVLNTIKKNKKS